MPMQKVALYLMNSKGVFVLKKFIEKFGSNAVAYIVSEQDKAVQYDGFDDLKGISEKNQIDFYSRSQFDVRIENKFEGLKFAIGWRWLIKNENNLVIFHDSLLPKYRGFAPLVNSLINKESQGGVTALFADSKYDRGDIVAQKITPFSYPLRIEDAIKQIEPLYFELVYEIFTQFQARESLISFKQDEELATYSLWLDQKDYLIDWSWTADKIKRFVDAVGYPYDSAKAWLNDELIIFKRVEVFDDVFVEHRSRHIGKVIFIENGIPVVVCTEGLLALNEIVDLSGQQKHINFRSRFQ